jgi:hypothetical protein
MKFKIPLTPGVGVRWAGHPDTFIFVVIGPKRPVAATDGTIAGSRGIRDTSKRQRTAPQ